LQQHHKRQNLAARGVNTDQTTAHKTVLEVSSWGEKFYIDFEDYSSVLSPFANVLEIMEE